MKFSSTPSPIETRAPPQPATLLAIILLVTLTEYHCAGVLGKLITSEPLMFCKRRPPPVPLSAALPIIRLALITRPGPAPSLGPTEPRGDTQSWSTVEHGGSTSGEPMIRDRKSTRLNSSHLVISYAV